MKERIQKLLSRAGYGSRREIERWIEAGEILVNGQRADLGQAIDTDDRVTLRGQRLHLESRLQATPKVVMYNKPAGKVCTQSDPEGRPTVFEDLPPIRAGRWIMIGRLDINTDGLLLFTTDGELANKLMHPSSEVEREYSCRVLGKVDEEMLLRLQQGVELDDGKAAFLRITDGGGEGANHWYNVVLAEGRNREVRRLWESQGVKVSRLIRIRYGSIELPRYLRTGHVKELEVKALRKLYESVGLTFDDGSDFQPTRPARSESSQTPYAKAAPRTEGKPYASKTRASRPSASTERNAPAGQRARSTRDEAAPASKQRPRSAPNKRPRAGSAANPFHTEDSNSSEQSQTKRSPSRSNTAAQPNDKRPARTTARAAPKTSSAPRRPAPKRP